MATKILTNDLDNCLINFNSKVLVTNLLDEYGGLLEEIAQTVQEFLATEEQKGKAFEKIFLLRGRQLESEDEVITLVSDDKLSQRKARLRDVQSMLYSAEIVGGSKAPPMEFVPLRQMAIKLDSLEVKDIPVSRGLLPITNETSSTGVAKEPAASTKKTAGALGAMFKKQETASAAAAKTTQEASTPKKSEPEKKTEKSGPLGAMFKKQEAAASKKSPKTEPEKKTNPLGAMFKKQEATAATKKSPTETKDKPDSKSSKKGLTNFLTKKEDDQRAKSPAPKNKDDQKAKSPAPKKKDDKKEKSPALKKKEHLKIKEEPPSANVSVNLFEESESSSDDEEALDALKREVFTDDDDDKPTTSNKRRRIIDSDDEDEDAGPEVKIERKEVVDNEEIIEMETEDEEPKKSETFMDEDGFIVTKKPKKQSAPKKPNPTPVKIKTPSKVKKESPKSMSTTKKKDTQKTAQAASKTKQGNIMNFFTKK